MNRGIEPRQEEINETQHRETETNSRTKRSNAPKKNAIPEIYQKHFRGLPTRFSTPKKLSQLRETLRQLHLFRGAIFQLLANIGDHFSRSTAEEFLVG